jgi:phosphate transport system protein
MARESFKRNISLLKDEVLTLGSMVEESVQESVEALIRRDEETAAGIPQKDQAINEKRYAIENAVFIQIATQQPMAHDLRTLAAILEIINELERMGDYAKGIAKVTLLLREEDVAFPLREFDEMAGLGTNMLHRGLAAFVDEDLDLARSIAVEDRRIDAMYEDIYHKLIQGMILNPATIDQSNYLMWVAHNLERLADRVVNICERTIFTCTGELLELDTEDEDDMVW